jgi:hypothetical protein
MVQISKKQSASLQVSFERQVLRGLMAEWDQAMWLLPETLRLSVRKPMFTLRDMGNRLGSWDPGKREIALSRDLIVRHRWDDVKEVLLHEMAHQVAHEGLRASAESAHGDGFRKACMFLRANPAASGTYLPLHDRLDRNERLEDRDRLLVRIQKLMALAESSNPHEAHAAMRKAHELISNHNLDLIKQAVPQDYASIFLGVPRLRHFRESYDLAHLLQDYYFVQGIWISAWVMDRGKMGRVLEISGTLKNVKIAEYVHQSVKRYIEWAWQDYRRDEKLNRYRKTDFALGIIQGFRSTLHQAASTKTGADDGHHLPARIEDPALARYVSRRYPHIRSFSRKDTGHDVQVIADGTEKGKQLVIAKGIASRDGFQGHQLPGT